MSNVKKLAAHKMAKDAIPDGGGLVDGIKFLTNGDRLRDTAVKAQEWAKLAVRAVREADDPNPWRDATDEEIAGEILRQVEERERKQRTERLRKLAEREGKEGASDE